LRLFFFFIADLRKYAYAHANFLAAALFMPVPYVPAHRVRKEILGPALRVDPPTRVVKQPRSELRG